MLNERVLLYISRKPGGVNPRAFTAFTHLSIGTIHREYVQARCILGDLNFNLSKMDLYFLAYFSLCFNPASKRLAQSKVIKLF